MAIRAYDELYLDCAQNVLGHSTDFAITTLCLDPDMFGEALAVSPASKQFAAGNPAFVAGMNGCELARLILSQVNLPFEDSEDVMYIDRSPEYWVGWALAFYQWYAGYTFSKILSAVPLSKMLKMYPLYHEMDLTKFADKMDAEMRHRYPCTSLKARRTSCGFSQSALAKKSGVPLRQIQLFEQEKRDINKTSAETLLKLSRALYCGMEDLMEKTGS